LAVVEWGWRPRPSATRELFGALWRETGRRAGDGESGDRGAIGVEHRSGESRKADLELVDRGRVALGADQLCVLDLAAAEGQEALAVRGELEGHAPTDPVGDADEMGRVLLRQVLD